MYEQRETVYLSKRSNLILMRVANKCAHQTGHFIQRSCKNYIGNYQSE